MENEHDDLNGTGDENYYAFLNVDEQATLEEITNAYRRLSRLYHPDKHVDPNRKREAEILFNKTKKAYEVLRDPHKRAIYDSVGIRGLETDGWELIQRTKTPQDIREEYERLARQREERRLLQRTNPKGTVVVNINATDIFSSYEDDYEFREVFPVIEISGMSVTHSIDSPLSTRDTATIQGNLQTHNGTGGGNIVVSNKRTLSDKGWIEFLCGAGNGPLLGVKGFRSLTKRIFFTGEGQMNFSNGAVRTSLDTTIAMQLDRYIMGYLSWRGGNSSGMSTTISRDVETSHCSTTVLLGLPHSFVSLSYTWKLKERQLKLRLAVKAGTFGGMIEYGAEKKVSEQSTLGATVSVGTPSGIFLKIKFTRATQSYHFPIHLSEEVAPSPIFYATVAPVLVYCIVKKLVVDPIVNERKETARKRQKAQHKDRMEERRREAEAAINLMKVTFSRIRSEEEARRGLVIVSALYGRLSSVKASGEPNSSLSIDEVIDVTIPLQCLVKDSKLVLHTATKSQLPGFFDPAVGEEKELCVQYLFHNQLHETTVSDNEPLRIPRQSHRVTPS